MNQTAHRLRALADNPAMTGVVPIHPATLRAAAAEIERLETELRAALGKDQR